MRELRTDEYRLWRRQHLVPDKEIARVRSLNSLLVLYKVEVDGVEYVAQSGNGEIHIQEWKEWLQTKIQSDFSHRKIRSTNEQKGKHYLNRAANLIKKERCKQIQKGYTDSNDAYYSKEELLKLAKFYIDPQVYPWPSVFPNGMRDRILTLDRNTRLIKGASLIAAEVDRDVTDYFGEKRNPNANTVLLDDFAFEVEPGSEPEPIFSCSRLTSNTVNGSIGGEIHGGYAYRTLTGVLQDYSHFLQTNTQSTSTEDPDIDLNLIL